MKVKEVFKMKERFAKLLSVKSIMTLVLTGVFAFLSVIGKVSADQFLTVFSMIVAFYFGTQHERQTMETEALVGVPIEMVEGVDENA